MVCGVLEGSVVALSVLAGAFQGGPGSDVEIRYNVERLLLTDPGEAAGVYQVDLTSLGREECLVSWGSGSTYTRTRGMQVVSRAPLETLVCGQGFYERDGVGQYAHAVWSTAMRLSATTRHRIALIHDAYLKIIGWRFPVSPDRRGSGPVIEDSIRPLVSARENARDRGIVEAEGDIGGLRVVWRIDAASRLLLTAATYRGRELLRMARFRRHEYYMGIEWPMEVEVDYYTRPEGMGGKACIVSERPVLRDVYSVTYLGAPVTPRAINVGAGFEVFECAPDPDDPSSVLKEQYQVAPEPEIIKRRFVDVMRSLPSTESPVWVFGAAILLVSAAMVAGMLTTGRRKEGA